MVVPSGLVFYFGLFIFERFFVWNFVELYLQAASADRHETFTHDWKCVHLDNVGPKIGGLPQNNLRGQLV